MAYFFVGLFGGVLSVIGGFVWYISGASFGGLDELLGIYIFGLGLYLVFKAIWIGKSAQNGRAEVD